MELNQKQIAELAFWNGLVKEKGSNYVAFRASELEDKTKHFPSWKSQEGLGLDLGCGCVSVFENCDKNMRACDPLADYYNQLITYDVANSLKIPMYATEQDELIFKDNIFDFVVCLNVIDHTPDPDKLLCEIWRVLKPGGTLYFEVNFDAALYAPHYTVWDMAVVDKYFHIVKFDNTSQDIESVPEHRQMRYWAEYKKV